jgi:hypothetical protein
VIIGFVVGCSRRNRLNEHIRGNSTASGVFPIAPTPFQFEGRLDHASIETLIAGYLKVGATGVTVLGIMGEAPKLEPEESLDVATRFIQGSASCRSSWVFHPPVLRRCAR